MSGPKDYVVPAVPRIITQSFNTESMEECNEILGILGKVSGVNIKVSGGRIVMSYREDSRWTMSELEKLVKQAKAQAKENLAYISEYKTKTKKEFIEIKSKEQRVYQISVDKIKANIQKCDAKIKELSMPVVTSLRTFTFDEEIKELNKEKQALMSELDHLKKNHEGVLLNISCSEAKLNKVKTSQDLRDFERLYYGVSYSDYDPTKKVDSIINQVEQSKQQVSKFAKAVTDTQEQFKKEHLSEYNGRLEDAVLNLNPRDVNSLKELDKLLKEVIAEQEYRLQQAKNEQLEAETREEAEKRLMVLKEISKELKPLIIEQEQIELEKIDAEVKNKEELLKINEVITEIEGFDYLSNKNSADLITIKSKVSTLSKESLKASSVSMTIVSILKQLDKLLEKCRDEDKLHAIYVKAVEDNSKQRSLLYGVSEELEDYKNLTTANFDPNTAERVIEELNKQTEEIKEVVKQVTGRGFVNSIVTAAGEGNVFKKEETSDGKIGCKFVRPEDKGVMFVVEQGDNGGTITPKGVVLSNGKKMIEPEELREFHKNCTWSEELNGKLVAIGMPAFVAIERAEEEREYLYSEEGYYVLENEEESIRYLRMCGYTDEEIAQIFGYETSTYTEVKSQEEELEQAKKIDDDDNK